MSAIEPGQLDPIVLALCEKYRYEEQHCQRVADMARQLFDLLLDVHGLGEPEAQLLKHAAMLHDIGHFISYRGHHRHSAYLIRKDATLAGYPDEDREIVAYIARNHRKKMTAPPEGAGKKALQLAALLRLADGLDHERTGAVKIPAAEVSPKRIELRVDGIDPEALAEVLTEKAALIKPAFGRKLVWLKAAAAEKVELETV